MGVWGNGLKRAVFMRVLKVRVGKWRKPPSDRHVFDFPTVYIFTHSQSIDASGEPVVCHFTGSMSMVFSSICRAALYRWFLEKVVYKK